MTTARPGLFFGSVVHNRLRPKRHWLRYRSFWLLVDIDAIDALASELRLLSHNHFNLFSIHDADYAKGPESSLREHVDAALRAVGVERDAKRVLLFTMPRILGYVFNPLSVYFCYAIDHRLTTIVYEVHNTFGGWHKYVLAVEQPEGETVQQECDKAMHVSPFLSLDLAYAFQVRPPGERISIAIQGRDEDGPIINTALSGERKDFSDARLLRAFFSIPLLTFKVTLAIHWEALRMWLKGFPVFPHPARPEDGVSGEAPRRRTRALAAEDSIR